MLFADADADYLTPLVQKSHAACPLFRWSIQNSLLSRVLETKSSSLRKSAVHRCASQCKKDTKGVPGSEDSAFADPAVGEDDQCLDAGGLLAWSDQHDGMERRTWMLH